MAATTGDNVLAPADSLFARLRARCEDDWADYTRHPFVAALADGSLSTECFRHYLIQDYLFLIQFARAYALMAYKAGSLKGMRAAAGTLNALLDTEMSLHVQYCAGWGITEDEMATAAESRATLAYTRYVLETGMAGDTLDLAAALAPCVVGYGEIAGRLAADPATRRDGNPYDPWIAMYSGDDYQDVARRAVAELDALEATRAGPGRFDDLVRIFRQATRLETAFWEMGLTLAD